jgi:hypothetical protein
VAGGKGLLAAGRAPEVIEIYEAVDFEMQTQPTISR